MKYHHCLYKRSADREREQSNVLGNVGRKTNVCRQAAFMAKKEIRRNFLNSKHQGLEITFQSLQ